MSPRCDARGPCAPIPRRSRSPMAPEFPPQLGAHVLLVEVLHRMPVQLQLLGDIPDRGAAAAPPHVEGKSLGVERIVGQELETLALHLAAPPAGDTPYLELQEYPQPTRRKI